jgi:hypothetical protein
MVYETEFESPSNGAVGHYRQNAFYIRMTSLYDLDPSIGDPPAVAVALHAHEYVHFLHNISTTAGQTYLLSNLVLLRLLSVGCDDQGYFSGLNSMGDDERKSIRYVAALMCAQLGTTSPKQLTSRGVNLWECSPAEVSSNDGMPKVAAVFERLPKTDTSEPEREIVVVGLSFITEGVAYEVDREMRRLSGMRERDLDAQTYFFPYLAFRVLVQCWSDRDLEANDYIAIGVTALACKFAGQGLAEICAELKNSKSSVIDVLSNARSRFQGDSEDVLRLLREQRRDLSSGDATWVAMGEYMALAEAGAQMRKKFWAPEFAFLEGSPTPEEFKGRIGAMLDCLVIQEKPDNGLDMYWIGPGTAATTDQAAQYLGSLQSALHFSQLHLTANGNACPTASLRLVKCPFSGGCKSEIDDGYPQECKTSPWVRFTPSRPKELVCWYAAGVKTLRKSENRS